LKIFYVYRSSEISLRFTTQLTPLNEAEDALKKLKERDPHETMTTRKNTPEANTP